MKKNIILSLVIFLFLASFELSNSAFCENKKVTVVTNNSNNYMENNIYKNELCEVEDYLFGTTFRRDIPYRRIERIEHRLFNRIYPNLSLHQRMNRIMANYQRDYNNNSYATSTKTSWRNAFTNRYIGQPTGFSPQVMPNFSPYFSNSFYDNRGNYAYQNYIPANTSTGVRILN